jgi:pantetheine-phosphate adenylyltransferase
VDVVIRGLRAVSDFEYELMLALMNRKLNEDFETVFLMPSEQYIYLHSSLVREVFALGGDISTLVPPPVLEAFREKRAKRAPRP